MQNNDRLGMPTGGEQQVPQFKQQALNQQQQQQLQHPLNQQQQTDQHQPHPQQPQEQLPMYEDHQQQGQRLMPKQQQFQVGAHEFGLLPVAQQLQQLGHVPHPQQQQQHQTFIHQQLEIGAFGQQLQSNPIQVDQYGLPMQEQHQQQIPYYQQQMARSMQPQQHNQYMGQQQLQQQQHHVPVVQMIEPTTRYEFRLNASVTIGINPITDVAMVINFLTKTFTIVVDRNVQYYSATINFSDIDRISFKGQMINMIQKEKPVVSDETSFVRRKVTTIPLRDSIRKYARLTIGISCDATTLEEFRVAMYSDPQLSKVFRNESEILLMSATVEIGQLSIYVFDETLKLTNEVFSKQPFYKLVHEFVFYNKYNYGETMSKDSMKSWTNKLVAALATPELFAPALLSERYLELLSNNTLYPSFAINLLMHIDNSLGRDSHIPNFERHFTTPQVTWTLNEASLRLRQDTDSILTKFIDRLLVFKTEDKSMLNIMAIMGLSIIDIGVDEKFFEIFRRTLLFVKENGNIHSASFITRFQNTANQKDFIAQFVKTFKLLEKTIDDPESYPAMFNLLEELIRQTKGVPGYDLLNGLYSDCELLDLDVVKYRFHLLVCLMEKSYNTFPQNQSGRLFCHLMSCDATYFLDQYNNNMTNRTRDALRTCLDNHLSAQQDIKQVLILCKHNELHFLIKKHLKVESIFKFKEYASVFNSTILPLLNVIYNGEPLNDNFHTLQRLCTDQLNTFQRFTVSLSCPKAVFPNITADKLEAKLTNIQLVSKEEQLYRSKSSQAYTAYTNPSYHLLCELIVDKYLHNNDKPEHTSIASIPMELNSLPLLLLFTRYLTYIVNNMDGRNELKIHKSYGRLAQLQFQDNSWADEYSKYQKALSGRKCGEIQERMFKMGSDQMNEKLFKSTQVDYETYAEILLTHFDNKVASYIELSKQSEKEARELERLKRLVDFLNKEFSFQQLMSGTSANDTSLKQIQSITHKILTGMGSSDHTLRTEEALKFLVHFLDVDHNCLFNIIFRFYKNNKSIDKIVQQTNRFMQNLIKEDTSIPLNDIFKEIIDAKHINFKKELQAIFSYFHPKEVYVDKQSLNDYIAQATALFGIQSNISCLYTALNKTKDYVKVTNYDQDRFEIQKLLNELNNTDMTIEASKETCNKITNLIGGLTHKQLQYFIVVNPEMIEFLANIQGFSKTTEVITANLISDEFNSDLINNTIHSYNVLQPFILRFQSLNAPPEVQIAPYESIAELCKEIMGLIPVDEVQLDFSLNRVSFTNNNISHVKGIYLSAGGTYNSESILPTVAQILKGSEFISKSSKCDDGSVGWVIKSNLEFSQERIEDFIQGLKISANTQINDAKKEQDRRALIDCFGTVVTLLREIHFFHCELDRVYHPEYHTGILKTTFAQTNIESLEILSARLSTHLNEWNGLINSLPPRLWLLRAHGLSSFIQAITSLLQASRDNNQPINQQQLTDVLLPFIKYCYPRSEMSPVDIDRVLTANANLLDIKDIWQFLRDLIEVIDQDVDEDTHHDYGAKLVHLQSKHNLFNVMMQLNNDTLPHPSQIFYSHAFNKDVEYFINIMESMQGHTFFLVGIPKDHLNQWLSKHYINQEKKLARVYIIATDSSMSTDLFNFLPTHNETFSTDWKNFKDQWVAGLKKCSDIDSLNLVGGPSGTGKTYFIRSQYSPQNNPIKVYIRPNFDSGSLIEHLRKHNVRAAQKKRILVHFSISPYCDFDSFNQFIYPIIKGGFVCGQRVGEFVNISDNIMLQIYIEIGQPINEKQSCDDYISETIPLIAKLAQRSEYANTAWELTDTERKCISYMNYLRDDGKLPVYKDGDTIDMFLAHLRAKYEDNNNNAPAKYFPSYLFNPSFLLQKHIFFKLLEERLHFLDDYINQYFLFKKHHLPLPDVTPLDLLTHLTLESLKLSDPDLASVVELWANPPMITSRMVDLIPDEENPEKKRKIVEIEYIDFSPNPVLSGRALKTLRSAKQQPGEFRATIAHSFGIAFRTWIVNDLCHQFKYVLTPEFAIRLMTLHNKVKNQRSLVLTGDTGVGKTFILLFYSLMINAKNDKMPDILYDLKERINNIIAKNSVNGFELKGVNNVNREELSRLPGDASPHQIITAIKHLCDFEPKLPVPPAPAAATSPKADDPLAPKTNKLVQEMLFGEFEQLINYQLTKFKLIDVSSPLLQGIKDKKQAMITSKATLVEAIEQICSVKFKNLFHRIIMHEKFTSKEFKIAVTEFIAQSNQLREIDPNLKMVVFIDEFNTSPNETLSLINEIFIDGTLDGESIIPHNIFWVGAMNPIKEAKNSIDFSGAQLTTSSNLAFIVKPPPPSMKQLFLNYGTFEAMHEAPFLDSLFALRHDICPDYSTRDLRDFILAGQEALRKINQAKTHVSIRDIMRAIDLYEFFYKNEVGRKILECSFGDLSENKQILHCLAIITSMGLTYYIRAAPGKPRNEIHSAFNKLYDTQFTPQAVRGQFRNYCDIFDYIVNSFCRDGMIAIPTGIASTEALKLNIFCIAVAINCKIPLCIVGPPGCSKTLSFGIVINNMNANKQATKDKSTTPWQTMPNADPFRYQSTPHTTDTEIKSVFERALNRQETYDKSNGKNHCVAAIDEAGLVDDLMSPMKVMHDYLDKVSHKMDKSAVDIAVVILSNKVLDAAKTNRMMMLVHPATITPEDEKALVIGCLFGNHRLTVVEDQICMALCKSYREVNKHSQDTKENMFHQRDFVFFLRHLEREIKLNKGVFSPKVLLNSLERNFGGIPPQQFKALASEFFKDLSKVAGFDKKCFELLERDNTILRIKESLQEVLNSKADPNIAPFRYIMLVDPTENESSLMALKELGIEHKVIRVGSFEKDTTTEALVNVVSQVKTMMAKGGTVVLVNTQLIEACFYDVFNRYFSLLPSASDGTMNFIANVSFGTHSIFCPVHPDFKIIVHLPLSRMAQTQLPWLNRFEKYYLSIDNLINYFIEVNEPLQYHREFLEKLKRSSQHFVDSFHTGVSNQSLLAGFSPKETISSLVFSTAKDILKNGKPTITPQRISNDRLDENAVTSEYRLLNWKLLQIARPESMFKCTSLPQSYMEEYLLRQEHFNLLRFFKTLFHQKYALDDQTRSNKWVMYTRTSLTLHRLKDHMDKFVKYLLENIFDQGQAHVGEGIISIIQLGSFKTSFDCQNEIERFKESMQAKICLVIADMSTVNQHQTNYIIDQFSELDPSKMFIIICHYPPEFSLYNQTKLNSLFLNGMEFMYVDSLGLQMDVNAPESSTLDVDIRTWIAKAYGVPTRIDPVSIEESFKDMFMKQLDDVTATMLNLSGVPFNAESLRKMFNAHPIWYKQTLNKVTRKWTQKKLFHRILTNISNLILSGKLVHSFLDSIKNSMTSYVYPVVAKIVEMLTNYGAFRQVSRLPSSPAEGPEDLHEMLVFNFIKGVKVPMISEKIETRFEPIKLSRSPFLYSSKLPLYDSIAAAIKTIFDQTLNTHPNRGVDFINQQFVERVERHPIASLVRHINTNGQLLCEYQEDYIMRTMKFNDSTWISVVRMAMQKLRPVQIDNILMLTVCNHFHINEIFFLKNMVSPLLKLQTGDDIMQQLENGIKVVAPQQTKLMIATLAIGILSKHIHATSRGIQGMMDTIKETTTNWCSVIREMLNRVSVEDIILKQQPADVTKFFHVFSTYNICVSIAMSCPQEHIQASLLKTYKEIGTQRYESCDILDTFAALFHQLNESLVRDCLPRIGTPCFLDIVEPFVHSSPHNLGNMLKLCNHDPAKFGYGFVKEIPIGWFATLFKRNMQNKIKQFANQYFKELAITTVHNPSITSMLDAANPLSPSMLQLLGQQQGQNALNIARNGNLVNVFYFVYLDQFRETNSPLINDMLNDWVKLDKETDTLSKIKRAALSSYLIERLATMLNVNNSLQDFKMFLDNNKPFATHFAQRLFHIDAAKPVEEQNNARWNHVYFLIKVNSSSTLTELLKANDVLALLGLTHLHISLNISLKESTLFSFMVDEASDDGKIFKQLKDAIARCATNEVIAMVNSSVGQPRKCGFLRMALFLITYQRYHESQPLNTISSLLSDSSVVKPLGLEPYKRYYMKIIQNTFEGTTLDDILINKPNKSKGEIVNAQLLVNFVAASIGSSNKTYLYHLTNNYPTVVAQLFPANEYRKFIDCGMVYRTDDKAAEGNDADANKTKAMKGRIIDKNIIAASIWGTMAWTCNRITKDEELTYLTDRTVHFANYVEPKTVGALTNYVLLRSLTPLTEISFNKELIDAMVEPNHLITEIVLAVWNDGYTNQDPRLMASYKSLGDLNAYEDYLVELIEGIRRNYQVLKGRLNEVATSRSPILASTMKVREEVSTIFNSPLFHYQFIHETISREDQTELLQFFSANISTICVSKYFSDFVTFLHTFYKYFARRLPSDYVNRTIGDCISFLEQQGIENEKDIIAFRNMWDSTKKSYVEVHNQMNMLEGGCRARQAFEKVVLDELSDDVLVGTLLYNRDNASDGLLISLIDNWMAKMQANAIQLRDDIVEKTGSDMFRAIIEGDHTDDIGNISFGFGENFMLIGSNIDVSHFQQFMYNSFAKYQSFDRTSFKPDLRTIENQLIILFASGKILPSGTHFSHYKTDFPFLVDMPADPNDLLLDGPVKLLIPESLKELIEIKSALNTQVFGLECLNENVRIQFVGKCSKLHAEELESFCRYLVSLILRTIHVQNLDALQALTIAEAATTVQLHNKAPASVIQLLQKIPAVCLKEVVELFKQIYLGFGYLYADTIDEPVKPDPEVLEHFTKMRDNLFSETNFDLDNHIHNRLIEWVNYLQDIIQRLQSPKCREELKKVQAESSLLDHVGRFLRNMNYQSPSAIYKDYQLMTVCTTKIIPVAYFPLFMRTIHEVLSNLKVKSHTKQTDEWKEMFMSNFDDEVPKKLPVPDDEDEDSELEEQYIFGQDGAEGPDMPVPNPDDVPIAEPEEEEEEESVEEDDEELEKFYRPIKETQDEPSLHCLLNWLRFIPGNPLAMNNTTKQKEYSHVIERFRNFFYECQQKSTTEIDIKDLYDFLFKESLLPTAVSSPGEFLVKLLDNLSNIDANLLRLFKSTIKQVCSNPQCNLEKSSTSTPLFIEKYCSRLEATTNISELFAKWAQDKQTVAPKTCKCGIRDKPKFHMNDAPQYLFISIGRDVDTKKQYNKILYNELLDVSQYYITETEGVSYSLHSVMCHEDSTDGSNKGLYSIQIKQHLDTHLRCTSKISLTDKSQFKDTIESNGVLFIFSKDELYSGKSKAQDHSAPNTPQPGTPTQPISPAPAIPMQPLTPGQQRFPIPNPVGQAGVYTPHQQAAPVTPAGQYVAPPVVPLAPFQPAPAPATTTTTTTTTQAQPAPNISASSAAAFSPSSTGSGIAIGSGSTVNVTVRLGDDVTNDTLFDWIRSLTDMMDGSKKKLIDMLTKMDIDTFILAMAHNEAVLKEKMVEAGMPVGARSTFINKIIYLKTRPPRFITDIHQSIDRNWEDQQLFEWMRLIGLHSSRMGGFINQLEEQEIVSFSSANGDDCKDTFKACFPETYYAHINSCLQNMFMKQVNSTI
ncbi:hypothetical protein SAMD00019534_056650 [Acytostelium subglobosum LB1]|uniref:hypothetical protein n=1 Tax=Acytostelium subglobosum LB1 TaxID=1410327 RepID=UPI000644997B|nr:hypothetical protein SAMD00019534_056650 [Acytostelium subglobosum LB1]GAM22490.1 hypothetical protein SAMD00019534_056650 [Acytostelium subglobosum LB1]|eukprot:XP_012754610.1 hypothetical protein SAMD00019534_056650 [Acytostelium subglobosum LB1]